MVKPDPVIADVAQLSSASLHEAGGKIGALPPYLRPLAPNLKLCGRALPVVCPAGDNLWIHHALYTAAPGEILVVNPSDARDYGYWGEVMALAAQMREIAGLVINGGVRDSVRLVEMGFPVFSAGICIRGTAKDPDGRGSIGEPMTMGDVAIRRGDVVFGDADGLVVLPAERAGEIAAKARARDADEQRIFAELRQHQTTIEIYNLPPLRRRQ